jgi:RHS repeat-associated protein
VRTLYDGFTFEAVREGAAFRDGTLTARYSSDAPAANGVAEEGTRYRWLGGEEAPGVRTQRIDGDAYTAVTARYAGTGATLYGNGEAIAVSRSAGANTRGGTAYLGKDVLGSVKTATGEYGALEERYEYDAFGKPYRGDFTSGVNLGYTGKPYDAVTGLYNYGYRDYQPETARFTTVDPVRDGSNWFAYVNNDPVNYVDLWGLSATDSKNLNIQAGMQVGPVQQKVELNLQADKDKVSVDYSLTHKNPIFEVDINVKITVPNPVAAIDLQWFGSNEKPKSNTAQNQQFDYAVREIEKTIERELTPKEVDELHGIISKASPPYTRDEIIE